MSNAISKRSVIRRSVIAALAAAIALDTLSQLLWKLAASRLPASLSLTAVVHSVERDPLPLVVVAVLGLQLINWLVVLERVDLSYAQPLTALSYISVCLLSAWFFGEHLDFTKGLGVLLVLVGVALVSVGPTRSDSP